MAREVVVYIKTLDVANEFTAGEFLIVIIKILSTATYLVRHVLVLPTMPAR
jgi:hypothetical protein